MKHFIVGLGMLIAAGCTDSVTPPVIVFETTAGAMEITVYPEKAPISAADFLRYVDGGYYDGEGFYRVVRPDNDPLKMGMSLIQGGRLDKEMGLNPAAVVQLTSLSILEIMIFWMQVGRATRTVRAMPPLPA